MAEEKHEEPTGPNSPEVHFEPVVKLDPVDLKTMEEDEEEIFKMRAKLFRYDTSGETPEWKERGTGDVKLLKHKSGQRIRLLMRRDKTFKICANHYISTDMALKPSSGSERAFVWNTAADFADEEPKRETLAIRFANSDNAKKFKEKFEESQKLVTDNAPNQNGDKSADEVAEKLGEMTVKGSESKEQTDEKKSEETNGEKKEDEKKEDETTPKKDEETKDGGTEDEKTESKD